MAAASVKAAAVDALRSSLRALYVHSPDPVGLEALRKEHGGGLVGRAQLAHWAQDEDWATQRKTQQARVRLYEAQGQDADYAEQMRMLRLLRSLGSQSAAMMRQTKPRSWEQLAQVQLKVLELMMQVQEKVQAKAPTPIEDPDVTEQDMQMDRLSDQALSDITNIVLQSGRGWSAADAPPPQEQAND